MNQPRDEDYRVLFEDMPGGKEVLNELFLRFGQQPYVRGGPDAARQTDFNAGAYEVVQFILNKINRANGAQDPNQ